MENYFKAKRVTNDEGEFYFWRILTPDEARHLWYNGSGCELCQLYDDGTESMIESDEKLKDCIKQNFDIGIGFC